MDNKIASWILLFLMSFIFLTCSDNDVATRSYPVIDTKEVTDINENGANLNADILNVGQSGILDHGFVYADVHSPTLDKSDFISLGETSEKGFFTALANRNLVQDRKYYVKAYVITGNNNLIVYGKEVEFISLGGSAPEIIDFIPKEGTIGDTVLIKGSGFSTVLSNNKVVFGTVTAQVVRANANNIWCIVPNGTAVGNNDLSIALGQFSIKSETQFILQPISLTSFTPTSASFGDTVKVFGLNFPLHKNLFSITLLGKAATILNSTSTELSFVLPEDVIIPESEITIKAGVQTVTSTELIKLLKPVITSFTPQKATKNTEVTISGDYFSPVIINNKVEINGTPITVLEVTRKSILLKIPTGITPGSYPISITIANQTVSSLSQIEIIKPNIVDISPLNGTWGNTITIVGENFGTSIADNIIKFNEVQATIISASSTELKVTVPNYLLEKSSVISVQVLTVDDLTSTFNLLFELDAPSITNFTPNEGKSNSQVTIIGENFNPVYSNQIVKFGNRQVEIVSASPKQLQIKLPTSLVDSDVNIHIDVAEQTAISQSTFHLIAPWRRIQDYPDGEKASAVAFAINGLGYVGLGTPQAVLTCSKPVWQYDPINDQWYSIANFKNSGAVFCGPYVNQISFILNNEGYVGLGNSNSPFTFLSKYSPADNNWYGMSNYPSAGVESAVAYSMDNKGYVTTGRSGVRSLSFEMWQYDPATNIWARKADLPGQPRWEAAGFSIGSKAYLIGGECLCTEYLADNWEYDASTEQWRRLNDFPGIKRKSSTAFSINGIGYLVGGTIYTTPIGQSLVKDFWKYDPIIDTWVHLEDFPGVNRSEASIFVINGKAYYGTGLGTSGYLKDFWEFDPSKL